MKFGIVFALVLLLAVFAVAAPSDYIKLMSHTQFCGGNQGPCSTTYNLTNPFSVSITLNSKRLINVTYRLPGAQFAETNANLRNIKYEVFSGGAWNTLNLAAPSITIPAKSSIFVRISAEKVWTQIGENEWYLPDVDNVICINGECDLTKAWWNSSLHYKEQLNITSNILSSTLNITWILDKNVSDKLISGHLDVNASCYRVINAAETNSLPIELEAGNLSQRNMTIHVFDNIITGVNVRWGYYDNLAGCTNFAKGTTAVTAAWNITGAMSVLHFDPDSYNYSILVDSANGYNWTTGETDGSQVNFTLGPLGYAYNYTSSSIAHLTNASAIELQHKFWERQDVGSFLIVIKSNKEATYQSALIRGGGQTAVDNYDFMLLRDNANKYYFGLTPLGPQCNSEYVTTTGQWYAIGGSWNGTAFVTYVNGIRRTTCASTRYLAVRNNGTMWIGGRPKAATSGSLWGGVSDFMWFNRTLSDEEFSLLSNYSMTPFGSEEALPWTPQFSVSITDPANTSTHVYGWNATIRAMVFGNATGYSVKYSINDAVSNTTYGNVTNGTAFNISLGVVPTSFNNITIWATNDTVTNSTRNIYTITKYPQWCNVTFEGIQANRTITYGMTNTAAGNNSNGTDAMNNASYLLRDGVQITNPDTSATYVNGTYNFTFTSPGNENFTSCSATQFLFVNIGANTCWLYLNGAQANLTINEGDQSNATANSFLGTGTLYREGVNVSNPEISSAFTNGTYNYTFYSPGDANYSTCFSNYYLFVNYVNTTPPDPPVPPANGTWSYYKDITISNPGSISYSDFVLNLTFDSQTPISQGKMNSTCSDVRFYYVNETTGNETAIPHYFYADVSHYGVSTGKCSGGNANALVYVRVPLIQNGSSSVIRMYYGNAGANATSNPNTTMFLNYIPVGTTINNTLWTLSCGAGTTCDVTGSEMRLRIDSGSPTATATINTGDFPASFWQGNKRVLWLGYYAAHAGGDTNAIATTAGTTGWDLIASGISARQFLRADLNSTGGFGFKASGAAMSELGTPQTTAPVNFKLTIANTAPEEQRLTNLTIVSWSASTLTFSASPEYIASWGSLNLTVYDTETGEQIYFNASIMNGTSTINTNTTLNYLNSMANIPQGSTTLTFNNASYYPASVIQTFTSASATLTVYLISKSDANAIFVRFHTSNPQGNVISGALITLRLGGSIVGSSLTDGIGIASFYLDSTKTYNLTADKSGFASVTQMIMPVLSDLYITMGSSTSSTNFNFLFANVTWSLTPDPRALFTNDSLINFTINSVDGGLEWWGLVLTYNGSIIFNQTNTTPSTGGTVLVIVNLTGRDGHIFAHPFFKKVGFGEFYDSSAPFKIEQQLKQYYNTTGQLGSFIANKASLGISDFTFAFIILALGFAFTILISRTLNISAGVVGLVILAFIALFGIFSPLYSGITPNNLEYWGIFSWIILVIVSLIIIRYGGF